MLVKRGQEFLLVEKERKDISAGKYACDAVEDPFATGTRDKPMMCDRHSQIFQLRGQRGRRSLTKVQTIRHVKTLLNLHRSDLPFLVYSSTW